MLPEPTFNSYLMLAAVLFSIGLSGVFMRRSLITVLLSIEVMFVAASLTFVAADRYLADRRGQLAVLLVMVLSLSQAAIGLALATALVRQRGSLNPDETTDLKW